MPWLAAELERATILAEEEDRRGVGGEPLLEPPEHLVEGSSMGSIESEAWVIVVIEPSAALSWSTRSPFSCVR